MRRIIYISVLALLSALLWTACEPEMMEGPEMEAAPDSTKVDFEITQVDPWTFKFENTTELTGVANWNLDNGSKVTNQDTVTANYGSMGTFKPTLIFTTEGGKVEVTKEVEVTEEIPFDYENDPFAQMLTKGGNKRTWKLDAETQGHLGVGPADAEEPTWWSAAPFNKEGHFIYDDEFTFIMEGRKYEVDTKGKTHVAGMALDDGRDAGFYGQETYWSDQYDTDVKTIDSERGDIQWSLRKDDGQYTISLNKYSGVLGYDAGGSREYTVVDWEKNKFIYVKNLDENGESRFHRLVPADLITRVSFDINSASTGNTNEYTFSIENIEKSKESIEISSLTFDFGDGKTEQVEDPEASSVTHTYMWAGTFQAKAIVEAGGKTFTETVTIDIAQDHPDYETHYVDSVMVTYQNFDGTSLADLGVNPEGEASIETVANPHDIYPNRSTNVGKYTKFAGSQYGATILNLPAGRTFDLRDISTFKLKVYADTAHEVTIKLLNTNKGGNAWLSETAVTKKISVTNEWQQLEFNFDGASAGYDADWADPDQFEPNVVEADRYNHGYYNQIQIVCNDGNDSKEFVLHIDDLEGPHVEGLK